MKSAGTRYAQLVFLHPVGSVGYVVHSGASGRKILTQKISCSAGPGEVSIKTLLGQDVPIMCFCILWITRATLCILRHPGCEMLMHYFSCAGGPGAVYIRSAPGHITLNLCFCIRWDLRVM
jgi:hypothetical protein